MKRCLNTGKTKGKGALLLLAGFGALMYARNRLIPLFGDDYPFAFIWEGKEHGNLAFGNQRYRRVRTMKELVRSQVSHYLTWSGRTVAETFNQLFLMTDNKKWFDLANTAVPVLQLLVCDWIGQRKVRLRGIPSSLMKALAAGYWFSTPHLCFTALWQTGATNYSWAGLWQSLFLLPYSLAGKNKGFKLPIPLAALAGFFAGFSTEAGGGAACLFSGAAALSGRLKKEDQAWEWAGFLAACAGFAALMLAPGNLNRYYIETHFSDVTPEDFSDPGHVPQQYLYKPEMFRFFFRHSWLPVILRLMPLQLPVALYFLQGRPGGSEVTRHILALEGGALLIPSVLMLSPEFPPHAAYSSIFFALSAMDAAWEHVDFDALDETVLKTCKALGLSLLGINIAASLIVDADWGGQLKSTEKLLQEHKGDELVTVPQTVVPPFWSALAGDRAITQPAHDFVCIEEDTEGIYSKAAAAYYGVGAVKATSGREHPYHRKGALALQLMFPLRKIWNGLKGIFKRK